VVGEYFQEQIDPESLGAEILAWLDDADRRAKLEQEFVGLHVNLKRDASTRAAQAILDLLRRSRPSTASSA
jgi:lipid-A-disaccharide synthase